MKQKLLNFSKRYKAGLKAFMQGSQLSPVSALGLGQKAVVLGLETLKLAKIHQEALLEVQLPGGKKTESKRGEIFFSKAVAPIVETHRAARQSKVELLRLNETLDRRTRELALTNRQLQEGILRRNTVEDALKKSGIHYGKLLKDSLLLQERLRRLTHHVLTSQENERRKISRELQDEIAQTLLGINVRLLTLKKEAHSNTKGLKEEIASTQRLVVKSAKSVRRVAREFCKA
jgi:signal transduction histidine kinase